jgi:hypothetical protein
VTWARVGRRRIGGVMFRCLSPGSWVSDDHRIAILHMMEGTPHEGWELYQTRLATDGVDSDDPDDTDWQCGAHICGAISFGDRGLADDVARLARGHQAQAAQAAAAKAAERRPDSARTPVRRR